MGFPLPVMFVDGIGGLGHAKAFPAAIESDHARWEGERRAIAPLCPCRLPGFNPSFNRMANCAQRSRVRRPAMQPPLTGH
jgi:hypothetical protein